MASSSDATTHAHSSGGGLWRRPASSSPRRRLPPDALLPELDPPPKPLPALQSLAFVFIAVLAGLQFLPATHLRDPRDPHNWIPVNSDGSATLASRISRGQESSVSMEGQEKGGDQIHIFSWIKCLDLRVVAVLANSTLVNSRVPENIHFHFFVPLDEDEKLAYHKLMVLFPRSNIEIIREKEIMEKVSDATAGRINLQSLVYEMVPFIIPSIFSLPNRYVYVSPNTIIKGNIEELFSVDLGSYGIAAAEDCSRRLGDHVNFDVVNAIQRTDAKSWVSHEPYDKDTCLPDFNLLLIDPRKLEKNIVDAIEWWSKILNVGTERVNQINPAIALSIYQKYHRLPDSWKLGASQFKNGNETSVLLFDGPTRVCSKNEDQYEESQHGNLWQQYLPQNSDAILSIQN